MPYLSTTRFHHSRCGDCAHKGFDGGFIEATFGDDGAAVRWIRLDFASQVCTRVRVFDRK